jgi:LysR family transcriptional regulator of beta-lactamase
MPPSPVSLNTLRVFEAAARHLSFTQAAGELCVTQAAVSHQIRTLEAQLGQPLFVRTPRALQLSDAGQQLLPALQQGLGLIEAALQQLATRQAVERLTVGVVGTFAQGHLLAHLPAFEAEHPGIQLRLLTHNNRVDLLAEGLDAAIRFGDGAWRSEAAQALMPAPLSPLCSARTAAGLREPTDLRGALRLRSFRSTDWDAWGQAVGVELPPARGPAGAALCRGGRCRPLLAHMAAEQADATGVGAIPQLALAHGVGLTRRASVDAATPANPSQGMAEKLFQGGPCLHR